MSEVRHAGASQCRKLIAGQSMMLCPGHELDSVLVNYSLHSVRSMRRIHMSFELISRIVAGRTKSLDDYPNPMRGSSDEYASAAAARDWDKADAAYLDACRRKQPDLYSRTLDAEGFVRAFNAELESEFDKSKTLVRWMSVDELESYQSGTFESRKDGGTRRGYKAFSLAENYYVANRPARMTVPISSQIRKTARTARYTALPRPLAAEDRKIDDDEYAVHSDEAECRIPDGTPVPDGASVQVRLSMMDPTFSLEKVYSVCDALEIETEIL